MLMSGKQVGRYGVWEFLYMISLLASSCVLQPIGRH